MQSWMNRAVTLDDLARFFRVPAARLERVALRHGIAPAYRLGRVRAYGPEQARRFNAALRA